MPAVPTGNFLALPAPGSNTQQRPPHVIDTVSSSEEDDESRTRRRSQHKDKKKHKKTSKTERSERTRKGKLDKKRSKKARRDTSESDSETTSDGHNEETDSKLASASRSVAMKDSVPPTHPRPPLRSVAQEAGKSAPMRSFPLPTVSGSLNPSSDSSRFQTLQSMPEPGSSDSMVPKGDSPSDMLQLSVRRSDTPAGNEAQVSDFARLTIKPREMTPDKRDDTVTPQEQNFSTSGNRLLGVRRSRKEPVIVRPYRHDGRIQVAKRDSDEDEQPAPRKVGPNPVPLNSPLKVTKSSPTLKVGTNSTVWSSDTTKPWAKFANHSEVKSMDSALEHSGLVGTPSVANALCDLQDTNIDTTADKDHISNPLEEGKIDESKLADHEVNVHEPESDPDLLQSTSPSESDTSSESGDHGHGRMARSLPQLNLTDRVNRQRELYDRLLRPRPPYPAEPIRKDLAKICLEKCSWNVDKADLVWRRYRTSQRATKRGTAPQSSADPKKPSPSSQDMQNLSDSVANELRALMAESPDEAVETPQGD